MTDDPGLRRQQLLRIHGRSVAWLAPLLLLVAIALIDFYTGERFRITSWIVLVPGIAAAICGVWTTAAFAVVSVVVYVVMDSAYPNEYHAGLPDFILVAFGGVLATLACAIRVRGVQRMLHMQDVAETTRRTVLRPLPSDWAGLEHAAVYLSADTDARVGGDFYDIQPGPYGARVLVGDVQGKGLGAVETAAALLGTFREAAYHEPDLMTVAARLEIRMLRHRGHTTALGRDDADRFATAVLLGFSDDRPGTVEVVNFGHEPPLAVGHDGVRPLPPGERLPLGMNDLVPTEGAPPVAHVTLGSDTTLLITTDGVTEARDGHGVYYALTDQVSRAVAADPDLVDPQRLVGHVRDGVLRHSGGHLGDDTTIFAVRRLQGAALGGRLPS
ncbi:serine/threonine-protein phosphatase [Streptomyces sp. HUAS TT20]|nr:PP2C family protein-serine/threonine phosphatase [Streptomyces sp. HUAS 15-9]UXY28791.1 serine/threonine-protein phosphatase [Streptomyces sp. HUAS 15-9]